MLVFSSKETRNWLWEYKAYCHLVWSTKTERLTDLEDLFKGDDLSLYILTTFKHFFWETLDNTLFYLHGRSKEV